jgi:hypothetical protein
MFAMKNLLRRVGLVFVQIFGSDIRDQDDGTVLGRALVVAFGGRVHLIGYNGLPLRPVSVAQNRVKYWRITIGFKKAEVPDYPNVAVSHQ